MNHRSIIAHGNLIYGFGIYLSPITEIDLMAFSNNSDHTDLYSSKRDENHGLFLIVIMALVGLLTIFVETMIVPALPIVAENLAVRSSDLAWVLTAYTLAGAVSIPIVGKMGEMWGRKKVLLEIMAIYVVGLIGAALSWDLLSLVLFRTLQGIGMGAVTLLMGMAKDILPPRLIPVGIGLISAMIGVGAALGMVVGGLMTSGLGWKNAFWVVTPVVVLMVGIMYRSVPDTQIKRPAKMDLIGSALLGAGLLSLLLALSQGSIWGWGSIQTLGLLACSVVLIIAFVFQERRCDEPIIRLEMLSDRNITAAFISMFFIGVVMFMLFQTLPYFLAISTENGGFGITSQIMIGLFLLPNAIMQLIFSPVGGKLGLRIGHGKILIIGLVIAAVGLFTLSLLRSTEIGVIITVSLFGAGIGLAQVGNTNMVACACSKETFGSTTSVNSMILTIGMSVGPVVASLVIGGVTDASTGYAYCWGIAALLALLATMFVFLNKANLGTESNTYAALEERSLGGE
jgi:MFS family permease